MQQQWSDVQPKTPDVPGQLCLGGEPSKSVRRARNKDETPQESTPIRMMHACQDGTYRYNDTNEIAPICEWPEKGRTPPSPDACAAALRSARGKP